MRGNTLSLNERTEKSFGEKEKINIIDLSLTLKSGIINNKKIMLKEKIYEDFTQNILPKIEEGLQITKEYAFDLGERYITYLTIIDSIAFIVSLLLLIFSIIIFRKFYKWLDFDWDEVGLALVFIVVLPVLITIVSCSFWNLIKDIILPEVRIYEELFKNK